MNLQLLAVVFTALQLSSGGVIVFEDEEVPSAPLEEIGDRAGTGAAVVDYENLKKRISWGWELKGKGASTHLQLPANRLPAKFKPNQKYFLGFGSPDLRYPGCPGTVHCRFLEHCKNSRFLDSFTTFAANACPISDKFIGVCCSGNTSVPIATATTKPIATTTRTRPAQSTVLPSKSGSRPVNSSLPKCGDVLRFDEKVVGGTPAETDEWPWMAAILYTDGNEQFCGGALITNRHVLTAAHCVEGNSPGDMFVRLGEYDLNQRGVTGKDLRVSRIKMHEQYKRASRGNPVDDIALLTLSEPVSFSKSILNICLPDKNMVVEEQNAYVTGWGTTCTGCGSSNVLLQLFLPVWKQTDCTTTYAGKGVSLPSTQICAGFRDGKKDSCQGDSGGPLMMKNSKGKWSVVGVVSFGIGCAKANSPGVYTKVSSYIDWIQRNARE